MELSLLITVKSSLMQLEREMIKLCSVLLTSISAVMIPVGMLGSGTFPTNQLLKIKAPILISTGVEVPV